MNTFLSKEYTSESLTAVSTTFEDGMEKRNLYQSQNGRRFRCRFCLRRKNNLSRSVKSGKVESGKCACVYDVYKLKNKIENKRNPSDNTSNVLT
jgi:hypothetical protein